MGSIIVSSSALALMLSMAIREDLSVFAIYKLTNLIISIDLILIKISTSIAHHMQQHVQSFNVRALSHPKSPPTQCIFMSLFYFSSINY